MCLGVFSVKYWRLCLFRRICGGWNYLKATFDVLAYANTRQHLFKREIQFFENHFQNLAKKWIQK